MPRATCSPTRQEARVGEKPISQIRLSSDAVCIIIYYSMVYRRAWRTATLQRYVFSGGRRRSICTKNQVPDFGHMDFFYTFDPF